MTSWSMKKDRDLIQLAKAKLSGSDRLEAENFASAG